MAQGAAYYRSGALAEAERAFSQAAAVSPSVARPALWMGAVEVARGHLAAASAWFAEALRRHPTAAEQGCATVWLSLLGIEVDRPRWHVRTIDEYAAFVRAANPRLSAGQARWLGAAVIEASARYRIDARLLAAVIYIESRFNHQSISSAGAEGLGQLMPGTAEGLGVDPRDPLQNLLGAAWLLRLNLDEFRNVPLALAAYNAGGGAVRRWNGIPPYAETQWYVWAVLWVHDGLRG
jgi:soluble lytic murein transglycosylase-like protein